MIKLSKKELAEKILSAKKEIWECTRRNSKYQKLYAEFSQLDQGTDDERIKKIKLSLEISSQFQISNPFDPSVKFNEELANNIQFGWLKFPNSSFKHPLESNSLKMLDNVPESDQCAELKTRYAKRSEILENGRYLNLTIDVSLSKELIHGFIDSILDGVKSKLDMDTDWGSQRDRSKDFELSMKVWDCKIEGLSYKGIAERLFPEVFIQDAKDRVKRYLKKAKKLIQSVKLIIFKRGG